MVDVVALSRVRNSRSHLLRLGRGRFLAAICEARSGSIILYINQHWKRVFCFCYITVSKNILLEGAYGVFITAELRLGVKKYLDKVDECFNWLDSCPWSPSGRDDGTSDPNPDIADDPMDPTTKLAAERALHVAVECTTDAANLVIDALIMREPGGYADILRVLMEESVVTKLWFEQFENALRFRDRLVHHYADLTVNEVRDAVQAYTPLLPEYTAALRTYLDIK